MKYLEPIIDKFIKKTHSKLSQLDIKKIMINSINDMNMLTLVKLDKNILPVGYAIVHFGLDIETNKKIAHFYQAAKNFNCLNCKDLINEAIEFLKKYTGIEMVSFTTRRNPKAFKKLFGLDNKYQEFTLFEGEVN